MRGYVNFYDPALRIKRDWLSLDMLAAAAVVLLVVTIGTTLWLRHEVAGLQARSTDLTTRIADAKQNQERLLRQRERVDAEFKARLDEARGQVERRERLLALLDQEQAGGVPVSYAQAMTAFARQTVPGLWLTGFNLEKAMRSVELRGRALDADLIPRYMQRLRRENSFAGNRFDSLRVDQAKAATDAEKAKPAPYVAAPYVEFVLSNREAPATGAGT